MLGFTRIPVKVLKKILLIDREPRVTQIVRQALEGARRYSIREEHDTAFALRAAHWFQPDLIMADLQTASSEGEVLALQLQNDFALRDTPLLCLSDFVSERGFLSAGILSGYSFLATPVPLEQLLRAVEQMLLAARE